MNFARLFSLAFVASITAVACSSSSSSSSSDNCQAASQVADSCKNQPSDGGVTVTATFDANKCSQSDQGKKAADCIVANKTNCDCILACSLKGSCP